MKNLTKKLEKIVKEYNIPTLEARNRDCLDFYEVSVWWLEDMLKQAYELGKNSK